MNKQEYLNSIQRCTINEKKIIKISQLYSNELPDLLLKIVSNCDESVFFDDGSRILSFAEILDAERDLNVPFQQKSLIPVADCGDNDFIVYDYKNKVWEKYNIVDETVFKKRCKLEMLL